MARGSAHQSALRHPLEPTVSATLANDIFLSLFHLWLVATCLVFLVLAAWDTWHALTDPHDWSNQ